MASDQLTTTTGAGSGVQSTTQSPQSAGQAGNTGTQTSSVQPGTTASLLTGQGSVALHPTALSTVSMNTAAAGPVAVSSAATALSNTPKHHVDPALLGFPALLLVVGLVLFWTASRSVKNTT